MALSALAVLTAVSAWAGGPSAADRAGTGTTLRVSVGSAGEQGDRDSRIPAISATGRYVVFLSDATNLVPGDTNGVRDVFVRDRNTGVTSRVSVSSNEVQGNQRSNGFPAISADGRYVVFTSSASNLVPGDSNGRNDVFLRDRVRGTTERVSVSTNGGQGNDASSSPTISGDGRFVAFTSSASNLVRHDTNRVQDVFLRDLTAGTTRRVSVSTTGAQARSHSVGARISRNGRVVAFTSLAANLVAGDTNGTWDVFVRNLATHTTKRISVSTREAQANSDSSMPAISGDGRYVAFMSPATNLVRGDTNGHYDVFLRDRVTGTTERVSVSSREAQADRDSWIPAISDDGRYVAFQSKATTLAGTDTNHAWDIYLRDRSAGTTRRVSVSTAGVQGNAASQIPTISAAGDLVAFMSSASNLVAGDTNGHRDVFVRRVGQ